ncbi:PQQ-binding-like beta-propeller repeat protein [Fimbriiglobus ruber]|nr:PQQ-binding-like beta-propeller repeat protein [Fimbriiglobus ruber]
MNRTRIALASALLAVSCAVGATTPGQAAEGDLAHIVGQSEQTYKRLAEAERKLRAGKTAEAVDDVQRVLDEAGDDLVPAGKPGDDGKALRPARRVAQQLLAQLPPAALRGYRDRADEPSRKLLAAGRADRDPRPLRTLVDKYFASRPAEDAFLLLGELAFERGEFRAAEEYWRRLLPARNGKTDLAIDPPFPDPTTNPAVVRARVAMAVVFQGDAARARAEVAEVAARFPTASGRLAGKDGLYAGTLKGLLDRPPVLVADQSGEGEWSSFAGTAARTGRATGRFPRYLPGRPTWSVALPTDHERKSPLTARLTRAGAVAFHPVVLNGVAYVADPIRVSGYDVRTGRLRFAYDFRADPDVAGRSSTDVDLPIGYDADFTLTACGGRLFARLGSPPPPVATPPVPEVKTEPRVSFLVCFAPPTRPTADGAPLELLWKLSPPGTGTAWEGTPVWAGGRLYAATVRSEGGRMIHAVTCYDDGPAKPDKPVWVLDVCDSPQPGDLATRSRHELLTLAAPNLVFCSNTGAVVAVDARTGARAWAFQYPKATGRPAVVARDLCPPVADGGRVFVAPTDGDHVYAFDVESGRLLWATGPIQVDHILGIARDRLVCAIAAPQRGIRGLNVANGSYQGPDGWAVHDDPQLASFGRGLVSDEIVAWPTRSALFFLDPVDGWQVRPPLFKPHGNLAFADGVLLAATPTELWGYVAERSEVEDRRRELGARPNDPRLALSTAIAMADAGRYADADTVVGGAAPVVDPPRVRAEWLADRAERALAAGRPAEARELLRRGVGGEYPIAWRARAAARLATLTQPGKTAGAADNFFNALKQPPEFAAELVLTTTGPPVRLQDFVSAHFGGQPASPQITDSASSRRPVFDRFDVADLTTLGPFAAVSRETVFPNARFVPLLPLAGEAGLPGLPSVNFGGRSRSPARLFVSDGSRVLAYRPDSDKPLWEAALPPGLSVTYAAVVGESLIAAGPRGAMKFGVVDGSAAWSFVFPDADPVPGGTPRPLLRGGDTPPVGLSDFALAGPRLIAHVGDHHFLAIDTETGRAAWVLDAVGRSQYDPISFPSGPRFARPYYADDQTIIVQVSTGQRWRVDPRTGAVTDRRPSAAALWDGPPARTQEGRVVVADGPGDGDGIVEFRGKPNGVCLVRAVSRDHNRDIWFASFRGEASLTGRPPRLAVLPDGVAVAVSRNHGVEIDRLLGQSGARAWRAPAFVPVGDVNLDGADTDGTNLYIPAEGRVTALRLSTGLTAWVASVAAESGPEVEAGAYAWKVRAGRRVTIAYPTEPLPTDPFGSNLTGAVRAFARFPAVWRLPGLALSLCDAWVTRSVPVLFLDPESGKVVHRLDLPATGPALGVHFGPEISVVVTAGRAYWIK